MLSRSACVTPIPNQPHAQSYDFQELIFRRTILDTSLARLKSSAWARALPTTFRCHPSSYRKYLKSCPKSPSSHRQSALHFLDPPLPPAVFSRNAQTHETPSFARATMQVAPAPTNESSTVSPRKLKIAASATPTPTEHR